MDLRSLGSQTDVESGVFLAVERKDREKVVKRATQAAGGWGLGQVGP